MAKIYSQLKRLNRKKPELSTPKPKQSSIDFLLNYSSALSVTKLPNGKFTEMLLN